MADRLPPAEGGADLQPEKHEGDLARMSKPANSEGPTAAEGNEATPHDTKREEHTPGPWRVDASYDIPVVIAKAYPDGSTCVAVVYGDDAKIMARVPKERGVPVLPNAALEEAREKGEKRCRFCAEKIRWIDGAWRDCETHSNCNRPDLKVDAVPAHDPGEPNHEDDADIYVPGCWRCEKCKFELSKQTIFMASGNIGLSREDVERSEHCPNDGEMMRRVTWAERAQQNHEWGANLMEEIIAFADGPDHLPGALEVLKGLKSRAETAEQQRDKAVLKAHAANEQYGEMGRRLTECQTAREQAEQHSEARKVVAAQALARLELSMRLKMQDIAISGAGGPASETVNEWIENLAGIQEIERVKR